MKHSSIQRRLARGLSALLIGAFILAQPVPLCGQPQNKLVWESGEGYRRAKLNVPSDGKPGFTLLGPELTGISWTNKLSVERVLERQNLMNGAGVAAGDFDGDGLCDLYFCNKEGANALFRNLGGWKFEEMAVRAGVTCTNQSSTGTVFADLDGDGKLDLLVNSFTGPNACFINQGNGFFINVTEAAGLTSRGGTTSLALGDLDGDGDLDLYVAYFGIEAVLRDGAVYGIRMANGHPVITGRYAKRLKIVGGKIFEAGEPDILYLNDGKAHFSPVAWETAFQDEDGRSMSPPQDFGLAVQICDINGDGLPDIYVCNDFQTPDRIWLNDGTAHFRAIDRLALRNMSYASMGVDFADLDRDGFTDFITVEMLSRDHEHHLRQASPMTPKNRSPGQIDNREEVARNALFWNRGDGTYAEIAYYSGVAASDWSWTPIFLDVDLDGFEDLLISNGHLFDVNDRDVGSAMHSRDLQVLRLTRQQMLQYPRLNAPKAAFRNRGELRFEDVGDVWGFNSRQIAQGMALADLDNDGDLDVVLNCLNAAPLIYRNDSPAPRLAVRLKGQAPNLFGIGARISVFGGAVPVQTQEMLCGGRYLSGDDTMRVFAAGTLTNQLTIQVTWRNGTQRVISNATPNYVYEVAEEGARRANPTPKPVPAPLFTDVSSLLGHKHPEPDYDDFARQPLLPRKFSQLGPGAAWCDLNSDGWDDLVIGSGRGGRLAVYRNNQKGGFESWPDPAWDAPAPDDQTGIVGATLQPHRTVLIIGSANYEITDGATPPLTQQFFCHDQMVSAGIPITGGTSSIGPLALADIDGGGQLELFAGGRLVAGRYPEPASSGVYRQEGSAWRLEETNSPLLEKVGLVSGAVFSDLNGDGYPELILACEWGPIRVFQNDHGKLREATAELGLDKYPGLWTSVTTGDVDGDGRPDIIAGNWGLNSFYNLAPTGPWLLYYGDFNSDGQVNLLEAYFDRVLKQIVPWRDLETLGRGMPWARQKFPTHHDYASANIETILGERLPKAGKLEVTVLTSMVFLNRGDHFDALALPREAQWAPAFGLTIADFDGDGQEDVFLSQNFFAVRPEDDRLDAGRGLWLRGDGTGNFKCVPGQESGIRVYGEQRAAAACDYDRDGRVDLLITQNGAETKLYHNTGAKAGLRVQLKGPDGNANGIGSLVRLKFEKRFGPAREIHAGSGYWSQDSALQVLATPVPPSEVWVRWPGGKTSVGPVPQGATEILVEQSGGVTRIR